MTQFVDNLTIEILLKFSQLAYGNNTQALANSTLALTSTSTALQFFTGATSGQIVTLPNATALPTGWFYWIINTGSASMAIQDNSGGALVTLGSGSVARIFLQTAGSAAGVWVVSISYLAANTTPLIKSGTIPAAYFSGNPKNYAIAFTSAFPGANYAVNISGTDNRTFSWQSKSASGFTINANTSGGLTGNVDWTATYITQTATPSLSGQPLGLLLALTYA